MTPDHEPLFISFEAKFEPCPPGTPAPPRPPGRPREGPGGIGREATLVNFEPTELDAAFARELADRVLEYVHSQRTERSPEQLAALIQQMLAKRPA